MTEAEQRRAYAIEKMLQLMDDKLPFQDILNADPAPYLKIADKIEKYLEGGLNKAYPVIQIQQDFDIDKMLAVEQDIGKLNEKFIHEHFIPLNIEAGKQNDE